MKQDIQQHFQQVLRHLYINPLEKCNLNCKVCYTKKTSPILSNTEIEHFVSRYRETQPVDTITFCGGEVFTLRSFPSLVNTFTDQGIFVQIITNGTVDKLDQLKKPNFVNLIVSLDGLERFHDANRGEGNFAISTSFLKKACSMGFHTEVFSIVTHQNMPHIDAFEGYLAEYLEGPVPVTYHPRKPPAYLMHHPISNVWGETHGFDFLTKQEMIRVMKERNVFPPKNLGCYQVALVSDGRVFGCCEGVFPIGTMTDDIPLLIDKLTERLNAWEKSNTMEKCLGCSQHEFMCGIREYLKEVQATSHA